MALMNFSQYAKHRGVSKAAVSFAAKEGRITVIVDPKNGGKFVESDQADREWEQNSDQDMVRNQSLKGKKRETKAVVQMSGANEDAEKRGKVPPLSESKAIKEAFLARIAKLQFEIQSKSVIPVDEVRRSAFNTARIVRDSLLNIPDRVAHEFASETDPHKIHLALTQALIFALEELTRGKL